MFQVYFAAWFRCSVLSVNAEDCTVENNNKAADVNKTHAQRSSGVKGGNMLSKYYLKGYHIKLKKSK